MNAHTLLRYDQRAALILNRPRSSAGARSDREEFTVSLDMPDTVHLPPWRGGQRATLGAPKQGLLSDRNRSAVSKRSAPGVRGHLLVGNTTDWPKGSQRVKDGFL
ncbi:hypothetical protein AAFF_G00078870 [Aldrovandia affinis]|uniref:Uncharacterized protein n=1 Tax=Aldrovandia affinis TaxID=143900 RepID=A0AAD7WCF6_9TELE|nr:hypothetical protein AAFF_G00078870 [Aldrovandia affinis]